MQRPLLAILLSAVLLTSAFYAGRMSINVAVPALDFGDVGAVRELTTGSVVDLTSIQPYLQASTWHTSEFLGPLWKDPFEYQLMDGSRLTVDGLGGFFTVSSVPGYYTVREENFTAFRKAFNEVPRRRGVAPDPSHRL